MSNQDSPKEKHPGLTDMEFIAYQISVWIVKLAAKLLKLVMMLILPSLLLYRQKGDLWSKLTAGFWPVVYAGYLFALVAVARRLTPDLAAALGLSWLALYLFTIAIFAVVSFLTFGHRLAFFHLPGGEFLASLSSDSGQHKSDDRAVFEADEVYDKR